MYKKQILLVSLVLCTNVIFGQRFNKSILQKMLKSDTQDFISIATSYGYGVEIDSLTGQVFASKTGLLLAKPLIITNNKESHSMIFIVSSLNKKDIKMIDKGAKEQMNSKGTWQDKEYLYKEWDTENPITKELWYKLIIYKKN